MFCSLCLTVQLEKFKNKLIAKGKPQNAKNLCCRSCNWDFYWAWSCSIICRMLKKSCGSLTPWSRITDTWLEKVAWNKKLLTWTWSPLAFFFSFSPFNVYILCVFTFQFKKEKCLRRWPADFSLVNLTFTCRWFKNNDCVTNLWVK